MGARRRPSPPSTWAGWGEGLVQGLTAGQMEASWKLINTTDIRTSENLSPYWNRKMPVIS